MKSKTHKPNLKMKSIEKLVMTIALVILTVNCIVAQTQKDVEVGSFETTIIFNGEPSNIAYYVPLDYTPDSSYKLIVGLHYCTGSSNAYMSYRNLLMELSDSLNAIIMCPDCHMGGSPYYIPDSSIINKSTDSTIALYNINEDYIYLTGGSCGGRTTIKYGLEYIFNYRGIIAFNPYVPNLPANYYNFDSNMPVVICSGTLDASYNNSLRVYDSLVTHNAHAKFISMEGVGHDFWIPEFNIEMMNGIHYIDSIMDIITSYGDVYEKKNKLNIFPNPFNQNTQIRIGLINTNEEIRLVLHDLYGNLVRVIFEGRIIGKKETFQLNNLNKGTYLLTLASGSDIIQKKMISL